MVRDQEFSIADLEKVLKYIKAQSATTIRIATDDMGRLLLTMIKPSDASTITITIYNQSSAKMPDVTKTETLFGG